MKLLLVIPVLAATSALTALLIGGNKDLVLTGANDFLSFYAGGKLAFTSELYSPSRVAAVQEESSGAVSKHLPFIRLPIVAAAFWPLAQLPYQTAYVLWQVANVIAIVGAIVVWPAGRWPFAFALAASLPLGWSFANGQNLPWLVLFSSLAIALLRAGRDNWAGLIMALCLDKYHLFLLVPFAMWRMGRTRLAAGFLLGGLGMFTSSFAVAGARWPWTYAELLQESSIHKLQSQGPNLFGLAGVIGGGLATLAVLISIAVVLVWLAARGGGLKPLAAGMTGSLLVTPHLFVQDLSLLVPVCSLILAESGEEGERLPALLLLTPFPYLLELAIPAPAGQLITLAMAALLAALALSGWQRRRAALTGS